MAGRRAYSKEEDLEICDWLLAQGVSSYDSQGLSSLRFWEKATVEGLANGRHSAESLLAHWKKVLRPKFARIVRESADGRPQEEEIFEELPEPVDSTSPRRCRRLSSEDAETMVQPSGEERASPKAGGSPPSTPGSARKALPTPSFARKAPPTPNVARKAPPTPSSARKAPSTPGSARSAGMSAGRRSVDVWQMKFTLADLAEQLQYLGSDNAPGTPSRGIPAVEELHENEEEAEREKGASKEASAEAFEEAPEEASAEASEKNQRTQLATWLQIQYKRYSIAANDAVTALEYAGYCKKWAQGILQCSVDELKDLYTCCTMRPATFDTVPVLIREGKIIDAEIFDRARVKLWNQPPSLEEVSRWP